MSSFLALCWVLFNRSAQSAGPFFSYDAKAVSLYSGYVFGVVCYCSLLVLVFTSHAAVAACAVWAQEFYGGLYLSEYVVLSCLLHVCVGPELYGGLLLLSRCVPWLPLWCCVECYLWICCTLLLAVGSCVHVACSCCSLCGVSSGIWWWVVLIVRMCSRTSVLALCWFSFLNMLCLVACCMFGSWTLWWSVVIVQMCTMVFFLNMLCLVACCMFVWGFCVRFGLGVYVILCQSWFGIVRYCPLLVLVFTSHAAVAACAVWVQELYGGLFLLSRCVRTSFGGLCWVLLLNMLCLVVFCMFVWGVGVKSGLGMYVIACCWFLFSCRMQLLQLVRCAFRNFMVGCS